jgi:hypothetical protein
VPYAPALDGSVRTKYLPNPIPALRMLAKDWR